MPPQPQSCESLDRLLLSYRCLLVHHPILRNFTEHTVVQLIANSLVVVCYDGENVPSRQGWLYVILYGRLKVKTQSQQKYSLSLGWTLGEENWLKRDLKVQVKRVDVASTSCCMLALSPERV